MEQKTISAPDKESQEQLKTDHLSVKENDNISEKELFQAAYLTFDILRYAHHDPDNFLKKTKQKIYPGEGVIAFTPDDIIRCLKVYDFKISKETVINMLEAGCISALYAKIERKNDKKEVFENAYMLSEMNNL